MNTTSETVVDVAARRREPTRVRAVLASAVGNAMEWYDFAIYGLMAKVLAQNFFPAHDATISLILTYGAFALSFLARPVGAALFGHIGDKHGRRPALILSAGAMALCSALVGLLPVYREAGLLAPVLLVVLRLIQGLSVGGEHATSAIVLVEQAAKKRRGFLSSFAVVAVAAGTLTGSAVDAVLSSMLSPAAMLEWGWRVPFLLGVVLGGVALALRKTSLAHEAESAPVAMPVVEALRTDWRAMTRAFVLAMAPGAGFYLTFIYLPTFLQHVDGMHPAIALRLNTLSMIVMMVLTPLFGLISDRIGRKPVLATALVGFVLLSYPIFTLLLSGQFALIAFGQIGLAVLNAIYSGAALVALAEMFERRIRCSAMSLSLNAGMGLIGGTAPVIAVYLVRCLNDPAGPAFYLMFIALLVLVFGVAGWKPCAEVRAEAS